MLKNVNIITRKVKKHNAHSCRILLKSELLDETMVLMPLDVFNALFVDKKEDGKKRK